jgi:hypothetical protein
MHDERLVLLQTLYEDEKQRSQDLQYKLNEANRHKIELEYQLVNATNSSGVSMSTSFSNLSLSPEAAGDEASSKKSQFTIIKQMEDRIKALMYENSTLKESVEKERSIKLREIYEVEEKYRGYLEKAKFVIKSLDPTKTSLNPADQDALMTNGANAAPALPASVASEIELLKSQLSERDKQVKQLAVSRRIFDYSLKL